MQFRKMRQNHSTARPTQLITVSCDTVPIFHPLTGRITGRRLSRGFAMFCRLDDGRPTRECGTTVTDGKFLWEWIVKRLDSRRTTWIVAHDAGIVMQAMGLFGALDNGWVELDYPGSSKGSADSDQVKKPGAGGLFVVSDPPVIIGICSRGGHRATILDVRNYVDCSMDELATFTETARVPLRADGSDGTHQVNRLAVDALIVREFLLRLLTLWESNDLGKWRWTAGGLSMAAFRHRLMPFPPVLHDDIEIRALERRSYRGGELIVPFIGRPAGHCFQLDINSLFPHVMRCGLFPEKLVNGVQLNEFRLGPPPGDACEQIAEVALDVGEKGFTLKTDNGSLRVKGRFVATLAGLELDRAKCDGEIVGWRQVAVYKLRPLFREFVDTMWALRQKYTAAGDSLGRKFIKLLLVSLYGKFGQYGYSLVPRPDKQALGPWQSWREPDNATGEARSFVSIGLKVFQEVSKDNHPQAAIAIASFVTAAARMYMNDMRAMAGAQNVFYQATDSLIVNIEGLTRLNNAGLIGNDVLGKFRIESEGDDCQIDGSHAYRIGGKLVAGWRSAQARQVQGSEWRQVETERLKVACRHSPEDGVRVYESSRYRTDHTTIGKVGPGGWVEPVALTWGPTALPMFHSSDKANDSAISSMRAAMASGGTGGDCSMASTTERTA